MVHEKVFCIKMVICKDYTERHGQQNIRFIEVNKNFCTLKVINFLVAHIHY
jgi:hypothetical protein